MSETMNRGDSLTWTDNFGFFIHAGAPENLEILFNGEPVNFEQGTMDLFLPPTFILDTGSEPEAPEPVTENPAGDNNEENPVGD